MKRDAVRYNCPVCQKEIIVHSKQEGTDTVHELDSVPISLAMELAGHAAYCGGCEKMLTYTINPECEVKMQVKQEEN